MKKTTDKPQREKLGFGQLLLWNTRAVSCSINVLMLGYLSIYCTDTLLIDPALVSIMLVLSKLVDGVTDMVAGILVDKTETKWGKARPYEIFIIGLWISTWLLFSTPASFSTMAKLIWVFMMYLLANSICYTFLNANATPYTARAFKGEQITKVTSYGSVITMLAAVIFNMTFPGLMGSIATSTEGWSRLVLMFAVPMAAIGILRMLFVPEKYTVTDEGQNKEKVKVADVLTVVKTNKYILVIALMTFIFNFVCNMGVITYFWKWIYGDVGMQGLVSAAQIIAIPLAFIFPMLLRKFSVKQLIVVGFLVSATGYFLNFFAGTNLVFLAVAGILWGAGTIPASMLVVLMILDCADYNEWKGIHRMEATMSSINSLASKVGAALGVAVLGFLLSACGYDPETSTTMTEAALTMIRMLYSIVPGVLYVLVALSMGFYKLDKVKPQMAAELEEKRKAAAALAGASAESTSEPETK